MSMLLFSNLASHLLLIKLIAFEYLIGPELRYRLEMASDIGGEGKTVIFQTVRNRLHNLVLISG